MQLLPAVMGALLFPEKDRQAALAIQEQHTSLDSGFMLLCFAFVPKQLAGRLDFAFLGSFSCRSEEPFLSGETALWQHFLNAALMIEHIQQCQCTRTEHVFLPQGEGRHGLCDKSQAAIFKQGWGKLWVILNQINAWTTGRCFPPASTAKFLFRIPRMFLTNNPRSTGWGCGAAAVTSAGRSAAGCAPPGSGAGSAPSLLSLALPERF